MKLKPLIFIIVIILSGTVVYPQGGYLRWGVTGGGNISNFLGPDKPKVYEYGFGASLGLYTDYRMTTHVSIWTEYNYVHRSVQFSENIKYLEGGRMVIDERNEFFHVPVIFKVRQDNEVFNATFGVGGSASILTRKVRSIQVYINDFPIIKDPFYSSVPTWADFGATATGTLHYRAAFLDVKYYMSLRNIFQGEDAREMRYQTATISMGYEFNHPEPFGNKRRRISAWLGLKYKVKHLFK